MKTSLHMTLLPQLATIAFACASLSPSHARSAAQESGVFVGGSPCGETIRQLLGIPAEEKCDLILWTLTLHEDSATHAPLRYELRYKYGPTTQGRPGVSRGATTLRRHGAWTIGRGIKSRPDATVYELDGAVVL